LAHFRPLVPSGHCLNATANLSIVSDHVHPFMATMYPSFQQHNAPCHKSRIISNWFLEHDNEFTVLKCPPQSPDLNPIEHIWDVVERELHALDEHPTNLNQLQDAILSIWANISKECFQHFVESMPHIRRKGVKHSISLVFLIILLVSVCHSRKEKSSVQSSNFIMIFV